MHRYRCPSCWITPLLVFWLENKTDNEVHLASMFGQSYVCYFNNSHSHTNRSDNASLNASSDVALLLKDLENADCLIKTDGWWTYEFCYKNNIKQYHLENGKRKGEITFLGHYQSDFNWNQSSLKADERLNKYHSQQYDNGTMCDVTMNSRRTEVRFQCAEGVGDQLGSIEEPSSCYYIITIFTTRICHHPYLKPTVRFKPTAIMCRPLLSSDDYASYLEDYRDNSAISSDLEETTTSPDEVAPSPTDVQQEPDDELEVPLEDTDSDAAAAGEDDVPPRSTDAQQEPSPHPEDEEDVAFQQDAGRTEDEFEVPFEDAADDTHPVERTAIGGTGGVPPIPSTTGDDHFLDQDAADMDDISEKTSLRLDNVEKEMQSEIEGLINEKDNVVDETGQPTMREKLMNRVNKLLKKLGTTEQKLNEQIERVGGKIVEDTTDAEDATEQEEEKSPPPKSGDAADSSKLSSEEKQIEIKKLSEKMTKAIQKKLEDSGLSDKSGGNVQVKIVTAAYYDSNKGEVYVLSGDDSPSFTDMIRDILTGVDKAKMSEDRHRTFEENYSFVYKKKKRD